MVAVLVHMYLIYIYTHITLYIEIPILMSLYRSEGRDCPYGICCPWMRGGWGLDALGKFFRRRPRRPRPVVTLESTLSTWEVVRHPSRKIAQHLEHMGSGPPPQS